MPDPPEAAHAAGQSSLRRMREYGVRPNHDLGQNFLVDDNLLGVIARAADLGPRDVVLEVGGGLGTLSEHLAPRVAHLHVIEVDRGLELPLREALAPFPNTALHLADAVRTDFSKLDPAATKVVANLPYGVAATVILKALEELPDAKLIVAMVQREVAERLAAGAGGKAYGATSVIAQLSCEVGVERRVPAAVFHPRPRVESALCVLVRVGPAPSAELVALVHSAFRHRRKTLAGSLALSAPHDRRGAGSLEVDVREAAREALVEIGHPPDARAERLSPADFVALGGRLGSPVLAGLAPRP